MADSSAHGSSLVPRSESGVCVSVINRESACLHVQTFFVTMECESANADWGIMFLIDRFEQFPAERCHGSNPEDRGGFTET